MQINPGYASSKGESRVPFADRKIKDLRKMIEERKLNTKIIIDGRVSEQNIKDYGNGMVDIFVGGTTCISNRDIKNSAEKILQIRKETLALK